MAQSNDARPGLVFPERFMKGVGMSVWQNSSDSNTAAPSNWYYYAEKKKFFGQKKLASAWESSTDFWNQYDQHIKLARESLGSSSFRFSFEWARIEPTGPGIVDQAAVDRYHQIIDSMIANGMEPMCTLHHFTHPQWFEEMGGFTKEENIPIFVAYCKRVFAWFSSKIKLWATFNEPTCFAFVGYIAGLWCPGKLMQFTLAGQVLYTVLLAHVEVYKALKAMPGGQQACIGIVHQHIRFIPKSQFAPHVRWLCKWMTYWFGTESILRFFTTGVFKWKVPLLGSTLQYTCKDAPSCVDWWGINYYSYPCIGTFFNMGAHGKEPVSDNDFRVYPQGLYDSISDASVLKLPIYITETGSADKEGKYRKQLIEGYCSVILRAVHEGFDVRGLYYWTLMDNIEWHEGFHMKFGLYEWDPSVQSTEGMRLRPGSEALREAYRTWPDSIAGIKAYAADRRTWAFTTHERLTAADRPISGSATHLLTLVSKEGSSRSAPLMDHDRSSSSPCTVEDDLMGSRPSVGSGRYSPQRNQVHPDRRRNTDTPVSRFSLRAMTSGAPLVSQLTGSSATDLQNQELVCEDAWAVWEEGKGLEELAVVGPSSPRSPALHMSQSQPALMSQQGSAPFRWVHGSADLRSGGSVRALDQAGRDC